jgi:hypothetical protein
VQLLAIIRSPWAAGHYNGGRSLMAAFKRAPGGGGASSTGQELIAGSIPNPADPFGMNPFAPDKIPVPGLPWDVPSGRDALGGLLGLLPGADSLQQEGSKVATGIAAVFIRLVLAVVVLGLAAALFYNGVRRLSGDRLPSPSDVARSRVPVM